MIAYSHHHHMLFLFLPLPFFSLFSSKDIALFIYFFHQRQPFFETTFQFWVLKPKKTGIRNERYKMQHQQTTCSYQKASSFFFRRHVSSRQKNCIKWVERHFQFVSSQDRKPQLGQNPNWGTSIQCRPAVFSTAGSNCLSAPIGSPQLGFRPNWAPQLGFRPNWGSPIGDDFLIKNFY